MHGLDARRARAALVEGAQEGDAAAGIVLPAVLAVEDDADQGRARCVADRLADAVQAADEIVGRRLRLAALVVEADQVAQGVVAEDDAQLVRRLRATL